MEAIAFGKGGAAALVRSSRARAGAILADFGANPCPHMPLECVRSVADPGPGEGRICRRTVTKVFTCAKKVATDFAVDDCGVRSFADFFQQQS